MSVSQVGFSYLQEIVGAFALTHYFNYLFKYIHPNSRLVKKCPLTISYHLYLLCMSKVWSMLHLGSVGQVQSKESCFMFTDMFLVKKVVFLSFSFLFLIEVSNFYNRILTRLISIYGYMLITIRQIGLKPIIWNSTKTTVIQFCQQYQKLLANLQKFHNLYFHYKKLLLYFELYKLRHEM